MRLRYETILTLMFYFHLFQSHVGDEGKVLSHSELKYLEVQLRRDCCRELVVLTSFYELAELFLCSGPLFSTLHFGSMVCKNESGYRWRKRRVLLVTLSRVRLLIR